jgi:hypothetical protein
MLHHRQCLTLDLETLQDLRAEPSCPSSKYWCTVSIRLNTISGTTRIRSYPERCIDYSCNSLSHMYLYVRVARQQESAPGSTTKVMASDSYNVSSQQKFLVYLLVIPVPLQYMSNVVPVAGLLRHPSGAVVQSKVLELALTQAAIVSPGAPFSNPLEQSGAPYPHTHIKVETGTIERYGIGTTITLSLNAFDAINRN